MEQRSASWTSARPLVCSCLALTCCHGGEGRLLRHLHLTQIVDDGRGAHREAADARINEWGSVNASTERVHEGGAVDATAHRVDEGRAVDAAPEGVDAGSAVDAAVTPALGGIEVGREVGLAWKRNNKSQGRASSGTEWTRTREERGSDAMRRQRWSSDRPAGRRLALLSAAAWR